MNKFTEFYLQKIYPNVSSLRGSTRLGKTLVNQHWQELNFNSDHLYTAFLKEPVILRRFSEAIEEDSVVCDVGAFHGAYSIIGLLQGKKVHSFEIQQENIENLKKNLAANGEKQLFEVKNIGVSNLNGKRYVDLNQGPTSKISSESQSNSQIQCITLDSYYKDRKSPDIVKIDVEGHELQVLQGAEQILENNKPRLFLEIHRKDLQKKIFDFLYSKGYRFTFSRHRGDELLLVAEIRKESDKIGFDCGRLELSNNSADPLKIREKISERGVEP